MFNSELRHHIIFIALILFAFVGSASAQSVLYVSAEDGNDQNLCTKYRPCREITRALSLVSTGGTIFVAGSGDYNNIAIIKSVNIVAQPGILANLRVPTSSLDSNAISIAAGASKVELRGLTTSGATVGLNVTSAGFVSVEDCKFAGSQRAFKIQSAGGNFVFKNTRFHSSKTFTGPSDQYPNEILTNNSFDMYALFDRCYFENNFTGVYLVRGSTLKVTIRDSVITNNAYGLAVGESGKMFVENSLIANSMHDGVTVFSGSGSLYLGNSTITGNKGYGLYEFATACGFGNNQFSDNGMGNFYGTLPQCPNQP